MSEWEDAMRRIEALQEKGVTIDFIQLEDNDIILLKTALPVSSALTNEIRRNFREVGIYNRVLILDAGIEMSLIRPERREYRLEIREGELAECMERFQKTEGLEGLDE